MIYQKIKCHDDFYAGKTKLKFAYRQDHVS